MSTNDPDETCQERVYAHPGSFGTPPVCGRPVKRDGLCAVHAAAKKLADRNNR